jgi:hypothetical protein
MPGPVNQPESLATLNPVVLSSSVNARVERLGEGAFYSVTGSTLKLPPSSFSGCDIRAGVIVPEGKGAIKKVFRTFAELQTISISTHRGLAPVRCLGESWAREYTPGTRSVGGTLIFSVLHNDVFQSLLRLGAKEGYTPFTHISDQIPPFTIIITATNELGQEAAMYIQDVTLMNSGMTLSIDDIFTETQMQFVAKWATPFLDTRVQDLIDSLRSTNDEARRLSTWTPEARRRR